MAIPPSMLKQWPVTKTRGVWRGVTVSEVKYCTFVRGDAGRYGLHLEQSSGVIGRIELQSVGPVARRSGVRLQNHYKINSDGLREEGFTCHVCARRISGEEFDQACEQRDSEQS